MDPDLQKSGSRIGIPIRQKIWLRIRIQGRNRDTLRRFLKPFLWYTGSTSEKMFSEPQWTFRANTSDCTVYLDSNMQYNNIYNISQLHHLSSKAHNLTLPSTRRRATRRLEGSRSQICGSRDHWSLFMRVIEVTDFKTEVRFDLWDNLESNIGKQLLQVMRGSPLVTSERCLGILFYKP